MLGSYEAGAGKPGERRRFIRELERITDQAGLTVHSTHHVGPDLVRTLCARTRASA